MNGVAGKETCTIATRGSALALWQARHVAGRLEAAFPGLEVRVEVVRTTGDAVLDRPLHEIGDKGVFTKELERALRGGRADMCVHSMKDVPAELPEGCVIGAVLPRADVRDVLVCGPRLEGVHSLAELPAGCTIGTGSLRRAAQLRARFPQIKVSGMRGNVDTRLAKAKGAEYDGAILAAAGIARLGRLGEVSAFISADEMLPAAGQGAIGVEVRSDDERAARWCAVLDDPLSAVCVSAERSILRALGGSCKVPLGAYARVEGSEALLDAIVLSTDGAHVARSHVGGGLKEGVFRDLAGDALEELEAEGARRILADVLGGGGL